MKKPGFQKLDRAVQAVEDLIGGCMFFIMMSFTGINVFIMFFGEKKIAGLDEIVLAAYVWITYIALGRHYKEHRCVSVDFLVQIMPPKVAKGIKIFRDAASVVISAVMVYYAAILTAASTNKLTNILKIPYSVIDVALVIGFTSIIVYTIFKYIPKKDCDTPAQETENGGQDT